ncbi:MAG: aminopeptidase [Burkholderiales bacterium PBB3]|nr:MAG: aminopeptidase [Burkholderiales bacterium PBB3]
MCNAAFAQSGWTATRFTLELEPQFETSTIRGTLTLDFSVQQIGLKQLTLDAGNLRISTVELNTKALPFEKAGNQLHITLPVSLKANSPQQLQVRYLGEGSGGLRFDKDSTQVATAFSTSQWMPCLDDPSLRAPFHLSLLLPHGLVSVGNGEPDVPSVRADGKVVHTWHLQQPMPSYLYGFAAGQFAQAQTIAGKTRLEYFGPASLFTPAQLQQVFLDSADMLSFYTERSGVAYPQPAYRQVLLMGPAAQEMAGFSVMGARYGTRVLADPQAIWLGAHEMAHQWWGNGLTNQSWRHFWLNEGIATFMTAAYLEHRFGKEEYLRQIDAARVKYRALRDAGQDKSLVFPDWDKPTPADRSLVYDKGALVMHELRTVLGEVKFWNGLKHYTQKHWGQSVQTANFKKAMEEGSGVDLSAFFQQWVEIPSTR